MIGIGSAPWQLNPALGTYARLTYSFVTGIATLTLVPFEMLTLGEWYPTLAFLLTAAVCGALHVVGLRAALAEAAATPGGSWRSVWLPDLRPVRSGRALVDVFAAPTIATTGAALCLGAALTHRHIDPGFYGFLPRIGPAWYVGLALVLVALVVGRHREQALAVGVFILVLVLTLTPALAYDGPRSQSAAKHVDFVMQIQSLHQLDTPVAVYNAWSGFFAAMAWLCHIAGIDDPMRLATLWPALLGLFRVVVLRYVFGQILPRADQCWVAVALAVLADSIGADYFSPQSVGFVVGMAAIGFALSRSPEEPRLVMLLVAGLVLAVTHQFSPYAVGAVLVILVLFRQVRPWWAPLLVIGPAVLWAAAHEQALRGILTIDQLGRIQNFRPPETVNAPGLERLPVIRETVLALLLGIAILGVLAGITLLRHRRDRRYWALACCPLAGLLLLAVNPYGQEGIFRAALFGLPWLALLASPELADPRLPSRLALFAVTGCLLGAFLVSSFGLDAVNVVRQGDLAALRHFQALGGPRPPTTHYLLVLGPGDLPTTPGISGGGHQIWGRDRLDDPVRTKPGLRAGVEESVLTDRLLRYTADPTAPPTLFALWSPVSGQYGRAYALESLEQAAALRNAFLSSRYWSVAYERDGTYLFRFEPSRYPRRPV